MPHKDVGEKQRENFSQKNSRTNPKIHGWIFGSKDCGGRMNTEISLYDTEKLKDKIYTIRGLQVMLDFELAEIYGYTTKAFNQQVKNNIDRFDEDFRFQLTEAETDNLRSKILTANYSKMSRVLPYAFTEQGIYMLMTAQDIQKFNAQYPTLTVNHTAKMHDRFLIIDQKTLYHIGASLKDLGKKCFAFEMLDNSLITHLLQNTN